MNEWMKKQPLSPFLFQDSAIFLEENLKIFLGLSGPNKRKENALLLNLLKMDRRGLEHQVLSVSKQNLQAEF